MTSVLGNGPGLEGVDDSMSRVRLLFVGMWVLLAVEVVAVASASAAEPHFFVCSKVTAGSGLYASSLCETHGSPKEWELKELAPGVLLSITSLGGPYKFDTGELGGLITFEIECEEESGNGSFHNPVGGGAGLGLILTFLKRNCKVKGSGTRECKVVEPVHVLAVFTLSEELGIFWLLFFPDGGSSNPFFTLAFTGCKNGTLNKNYEIKGEMAAKSLGGGKLRFKAGEKESLSFLGEPAVLEGESLLLTDEGGIVQVLLS